MINLASNCSELNRHDEAARLYRELTEIRRRALGEEHPDTLQSMGRLGVALHRAGEWQEAVDAADQPRSC